MKKIIALSALLLATCVVFAQDADTAEPLKNKRGITILPQVGEWGLGVSADPFLRYLGNVMNGSTSNSGPSFSYTSQPMSNVALFGKYVKSEDTYYRARLNINISTDIDKEVIAADQLIPPANGFPAFTEDWRKSSNQTVVLAAGLEKRRGSTRVQGLYGAELILGYSGGQRSYDYGNPISASVQNPTTFDFGDNVNGPARVTEVKLGTSVFAGARGFIGVEYFIAPRISLSGEFGYTIGLNSTGKSVVTSEFWNTGTNSVISSKSDDYQNGRFLNNATTSFSARLDNINGFINIMFYF